jgi:hypothetical protein
MGRVNQYTPDSGDVNISEQEEVASPSRVESRWLDKGGEDLSLHFGK